MKKEYSDMLDGFEFVPADGAPFITLDNQRRFYINRTARKLLGVKPYDRLAVAFRADNKALAIVKPGVIDDIHADLAQYVIDKRYYMSAKRFVKQHPFPIEEAPYKFAYDRGSSDGKVFIFRLASE